MPRTKNVRSAGTPLFEKVTEAPIDVRPLADQIQESFLDYAMSVIVSRALPDVRDGLKPVHRRILWDMERQGLRPDRPFVKSARVTGDTMAKYHPHGDASIYEALVRMAQPFSLRHPLIDFHGNYGSPDFSPAAPRYTECRLSEMAMVLLADIEEDTVDFVGTYDGSSIEPVVLPSRVPHLLVNGSQGIAVGMATSIPPHNLVEVCAAAQHLIRNPDATVDELIGFVNGPDFPTGGTIMGRAGFVQAYQTGRGNVRLRCAATIEQDKKSTRIVVTELPYQESGDSIAEKANVAVSEGKLKGLKRFVNESAEGVTRLVFEVADGADPNVVLNALYKFTPMQTSFPMNLVALVDGVPRTLNLKQILQHWIEHQAEVVTRRTRHRLDKAEYRLHVVQGLLRAVDMLDEIIAAIRVSKDRAVAREALCGAGFGFTEIQANAILDMPLGKLTQIGRDELLKEERALTKSIAGYRKILGSRRVLMATISEELGEFAAKHGSERLTRVSEDSGDIHITEAVLAEPSVVSVTARGYVKATPRKTRGSLVASPGAGDTLVQVFDTNTTDYLLFVTSAGRVYKARVTDIPTERLTAAQNLFDWRAAGEKLVCVLDGRDGEQHDSLLLVTSDGTVKRLAAGDVNELSTRRDGAVIVGLGEGVELVAASWVDDTDHVVLFSGQGSGLRFAVSEVRQMGRVAAGVRGISLRDADRVVAAVTVDPDDTGEVFTVTGNGWVKRTRLSEFPVQSRAGKGVQVFRNDPKKGVFVGAVTGQSCLLVSDDATVTVRAADVPVQPRDGGGTRVTETVSLVVPVPVTDL